MYAFIFYRLIEGKGGISFYFRIASVSATVIENFIFLRTLYSFSSISASKLLVHFSKSVFYAFHYRSHLNFEAFILSYKILFIHNLITI